MLVDLKNLKCNIVEKQIHDMIARLNGNHTNLIRHEKGVYEVGHFSFKDMIVEETKRYFAISNLPSYGVCDNYQQILKRLPELITSNKEYVISITPVVKANQPRTGGWRWHKWGPYIGKEKITAEYLYDEPIIEKLYIYNIFELI